MVPVRGRKDFSLRGRMVQLVNKELKVQNWLGQEGLIELRAVWLKLPHGHHCFYVPTKLQGEGRCLLLRHTMVFIESKEGYWRKITLSDTSPAHHLPPRCLGSSRPCLSLS